MESSSEDSFAWTSASSDTDGPDSVVNMVYEEESDSGKIYKKKLKKELFLNGEHNEHDESATEKRRSKKKVKRETRSQSPSPGARVNGHDSSTDAERMLQSRVKEERASFVVPRESPRRRAAAGAEPESPRKKKKRRRDTDTDAADAEPKKKKKKRKRENSEVSYSIDETPEPVVDKFEAEETVVETRRPEPTVNGHVASEGAPAKPFTSKEFVDDDDSSGDDRRAPPAAAAPAPARALRISERITFEDEPEPEPSPALALSPSPSPSPVTSSAPSRAASPGRAGAGRLGRFLRAHAHMQPVIGALERGAGVGPDDDVWLLACPRDLPAAALLGATLGVERRCKLGVGGRAYEAAPVPCAARVALLARGAGFVVRAVRLHGALRLRERVPRVRAPEPEPDDEPERIPLPETRPRHPLLGAGYERAARLAPDVRRRLRAAGTRAPEPEPEPGDAPDRREKKKKKKKHRERPEPDAPEPEPEPEPEPVSRKRKRSSRNEPEEPSESEEPRKSKKKKKEKKEKRRREDAALWDSERAIEESLFGR